MPILVYLVMVPMWSRARRFANVYAFAALDSFSVILWLSAWAAVASYVSAGKGKGDAKGKSGCDNFKYGSSGRCKLSETIIVFAVFEMLLFCATAMISFRAVMSFKRTGMMPENLPANGLGGSSKNDFSAQTQNDFSSNMRNDDEDLDDPGRSGRQEYAYQKPSLDDAYAPIRQSDHENDIAHLPAVTPTSPLNHSGLGIQTYDTSYRPGPYNPSAFSGVGPGQPLTMPEPRR